MWIGSPSDTKRILFERTLKGVSCPHIALVVAIALFWASLSMMSGMRRELQSVPTALPGLYAASESCMIVSLVGSFGFDWRVTLLI